MQQVIALGEGVDQSFTGREDIYPGPVVAPRRLAVPVGVERANAHHPGIGGRPERAPAPIVARRRHQDRTGVAAQPFLHDLEAEQREVVAAVGAERQRDDLRAPSERGGYLLDQVGLEDRAELGECPVHPDVGVRCHGPRDAGRERPVAGVGENARRVATDRVLRFARDAPQPLVLGVRTRQQAAVGDHYQDALAVARLGGHPRVGLRAARNFLRFRGRTGTGGRTDVEEMIGCSHPFAERPIDVGAGFLHAPALAGRELEPGQAAHVVVVLNRGTGYYRRHPVHIGVPDQQRPIAMVISHLASFRPVGRVSRYSAETSCDTWYA